MGKLLIKRANTTVVRAEKRVASCSKEEHMKSSRLVIDYNDLVKEDRIHGRVYPDPEIFEERTDKVFHRGLVYVRTYMENTNP